MKKIILVVILIVIASTIPSYSAKYAGEFLYLGVGGRPLALGGAYVAESGDVLSGYYNPAGLSAIGSQQAIFMHSETFGGLLSHDFVAYARPIGKMEDSTAIGVSLYRLGGGGIIVTGVDQTGRFYKVKEASHADYAGYLSYSKIFKNYVRIGASAKLIYRKIIDDSAYGIGLDLGALYSITDWADIGLNLQDITTTLLSYSTGNKESVNPTAKIGTKFHRQLGRFAGALFSDFDFRFEGRQYASQAHFGRISIDTHFGLELSYLDKIAARIGSDVGNLTLGAGLRFNRFTIDMALRQHSDLDNTFLGSLAIKF